MINKHRIPQIHYYKLLLFMISSCDILLILHISVNSLEPYLCLLEWKVVDEWEVQQASIGISKYGCFINIYGNITMQPIQKRQV